MARIKGHIPISCSPVSSLFRWLFVNLLRVAVQEPSQPMVYSIVEALEPWHRYWKEPQLTKYHFFGRAPSSQESKYHINESRLSSPQAFQKALCEDRPPRVFIFKLNNIKWSFVLLSISESVTWLLYRHIDWSSIRNNSLGSRCCVYHWNQLPWSSEYKPRFNVGTDDTLISFHHLSIFSRQSSAHEMVRLTSQMPACIMQVLSKVFEQGILTHDSIADCKWH